MSQVEDVGFRYPKKLVHEYGAKAGLLMYVAEYLPEIPQMPMVVSRVDELAKNFLARVDQAGIPWPRIFRSSAVEELVGFECYFQTHIVDTFKGEDEISRYFNMDGDYELLENDAEFNGRLEDLVREIVYSPRKMEGDLLSSEINVIAAEVAPSKYIGTFIKHPNRPDFYLTTFSEGNKSLHKSTFMPQHTLTFNPRRGFYSFGREFRNTIDLTDEMIEDLEKVISWHDAITGLPDMDSEWVYQIEYGLEPARLFQIRPFKLVQMVSFIFDSMRGGPFEPITLGVTDGKGDDYETVSVVTRTQKTDLPALLLTNIHRLLRFSIKPAIKPQGYFISDCGGILTHEDIKYLRQSRLSLLYPTNLPAGLVDGMIVNIRSTGHEVRITDKLTGEEIY